MDNSSFKSDKQLWESYRKAIYRVYEPAFVFKIGCSSPMLVALLAKFECDTFAYITAYNPNGIVASNRDNLKANISLKEKIEGEYKIFEGIGESEDGSWVGEHSYLILGIPLNEALALKAEFNQKAIVFGSADGIGLLV